MNNNTNTNVLLSPYRFQEVKDNIVLNAENDPIKSPNVTYEKLRYSDRLKQNRWMSFIPSQGTLVYDVDKQVYYEADEILMSQSSYHGTDAIYNHLKNEYGDRYNELHMLSVIYRDTFTDHRLSTLPHNLDNIDLTYGMFNDAPRVTPLSNGVNVGDIQAFIGGGIDHGDYTFIKENNINASVESIASMRECKEETGFDVDYKNIHTIGTKSVSLQSHKYDNTSKKITTYMTLAHVKYLNIGASSSNTVNNLSGGYRRNKVISKRKVGMCIYGTRDEIMSKIAELPRTSLDDNIIGLVVLPIEYSEKIDKHARSYAYIWNTSYYSGLSSTLDMHKYVQRKTKLRAVDDSNRYELSDEIYNANGVIVKKGTYRMDDGDSVDILVEIVDENNDSCIVLSDKLNINSKIYNRECGNPFICTYGVFDMENTIVPGKYIVVYEYVKGYKFSGLDYNVNVENYILYVIYNLIYSVHICGADNRNLFIDLDDVIYKNSDVSIVNIYSSANSTLSNIVEQLTDRYPDCSIALTGLFQYMMDFDTNDRNYIDNLEIMLGIVLNMISYRVLK